ncbi:hypothetical protein MMC29_001052 [Sticta canariensis]|nr:hypothetical protein [Sticta canariensis]
MDARTSLDRQIFIAGFEEDFMQRNPNQRNDPLAPRVYNFDVIPRYQWSDYVIIGRHFTFRNYEKRDAAIASLLKIKFHDYEFPELDSFEPWHRQWLGNSEGPQNTHWALQRDGDKLSDAVSNEEGWRSWHLMKDFERRSGLAALRDLLLLVDPQSWSEHVRFAYEIGS